MGVRGAPEEEGSRRALGGVAFASLLERVPWGRRASYRVRCCRWRAVGAPRSRFRRRPPAGRTCCRGSDATGWARWMPPGWQCCRTAPARRLPPPRSPSCRPAMPRRSVPLPPLLSSAAGERIISEGAVSAPPPASPLLLALRAASPSALSKSARRRGAGSVRGRGGGAAFIWRLGSEPGGGGRGGGKDHPAHPHAVAASALPAVGPGLMSSAANHLARGPEAGGKRCADNGQGRAASQGPGGP